MSNRSIATVATTGSERAIRRLIALIVLCCDPLAIALNRGGVGAAIHGWKPRAPSPRGETLPKCFSAAELARLGRVLSAAV